MQQSVKKDLRGKINKTPTSAFKMCTAGRFGPRCCKSQLKDEVTSFTGWKVHKLEKILYSYINLQMHTFHFSSDFFPLSEIIALL